MLEAIKVGGEAAAVIATAVTHAETETAIIIEAGDAHALDHAPLTAITAPEMTGIPVIGETVTDGTVVNSDAVGTMSAVILSAKTATRSLPKTSVIAVLCLSNSLPLVCALAS